MLYNKVDIESRVEDIKGALTSHIEELKDFTFENVQQLHKSNNHNHEFMMTVQQECKGVNVKMDFLLDQAKDDTE